MNDHAYNEWLSRPQQCLVQRNTELGNLFNNYSWSAAFDMRNALAPSPRKLVHPSRYLFPKPGQPKLDWVPSWQTDIRVLFRRVRRQLEEKTE